ncbi:Txe/YoeB family addiction module toxin [Alsobacter sp. KACC 23698]|uniref:Putative mRNA interferase YoeB n=1 Tax=Alsobacter sp. KACC 23698 TaxID=3149229 RepID=A0AAU7JDT8_9HYPH
MRIVFSQAAWDDYLHWRQMDRKMLQRIEGLIKECLRTSFAGRGKPEPLRGELSGCWSRPIDLERRLVCRVEADALQIAQCRYH